jgi:hypothetical protein
MAPLLPAASPGAVCLQVCADRQGGQVHPDAAPGQGGRQGAGEAAARAPACGHMREWSAGGGGAPRVAGQAVGPHGGQEQPHQEQHQQAVRGCRWRLAAAAAAATARHPAARSAMLAASRQAHARRERAASTRGAGSSCGAFRQQLSSFQAAAVELSGSSWGAVTQQPWM